MKYDPDIHHRKSIRLSDYNYSTNGMYFITICTQERAALFGEVTVGAGRRANLLHLVIDINYPGFGPIFGQSGP